jgi:hypothetical protein
MKTIKRKCSQSFASSTRGASLWVVMTLSMAMLIVAGFTLDAMRTNRKLLHQAAIRNEAVNGTEAVAEYALAELQRRADSLSSMGSTNPLSGWTLTTAEVAELSGASGNNRLVSTSFETKVSDLSPRPTSPMLLDPNDPVNASDPDKGKTLIVRNGYVFAKSSARDTSTGRVSTAYSKQTIQVREQSWFNYAVFYNMDMEFHAGPDFSITGPVHTNENAYVLEGAGSTLQASSTFTAAKKIIRALKYYLPAENIVTHGSNTFSGTVQFTNGTSYQTMTTAMDSNRSGFKSFAESRWNKYVQDISFSVPRFTPDGMPTYIPDDYTTTGVNERRNYAYLLIEPQLSSDSANTPIAGVPSDAVGGKTYYKTGDAFPYTTGRFGRKSDSAEALKFSAIAGLVIKVRPVDTASTITAGAPQLHWVLCWYSTEDNTKPVNKNNPALRNADGTPVEHIIDPFGPCADDPGVPIATNQRLTTRLKRALLEAIQGIPYKETGASDTGSGALKSYDFKIPTVGGAGSLSTLPTTLYPMFDRRQAYTVSDGSMNNMRGAYNVLRIDMGKLDALINDTTAGLWTNPSDGTTLYDVSKSWSGIVYVEFPLATKEAGRFAAATPSTDMIRRSIPSSGLDTPPGYALVLTNAKKLPQLASAPGLRDDGFTIAANGPVYLHGPYNADNLSGTGSATTPDGTATEVPSLVAADAVTVLSSGFRFQDTTTVTNPAASGFTEISTAFITGLVPTIPAYQNQWSGGVHNFIRFLEDWGGVTYRYRGSLAALFESEVAVGAYHEGNNPFYSPPTRDMGYHQFLSQGWFPPGTPVKRTIRRMNYEDITKAAYDATPVAPPAAN